MSRVWWLYDAKFQCPFRSAEKLCMYLEGRNKPLYHPLSDIGDHVVVVNTKEVAMADELWRKQSYFHDTRYIGGKSWTSAWRMHDVDPTMIVQKAVYSALPKNLLRRSLMRRLHLFPDENVPQDVLGNVTDTIRQIQAVPKRLEDYSEEEVYNFPRLFDWPEHHEMFKRLPLEEVQEQRKKAREAMGKPKKVKNRYHKVHS